MTGTEDSTLRPVEETIVDAIGRVTKRAAVPHVATFINETIILANYDNIAQAWRKMLKRLGLTDEEFHVLEGLEVQKAMHEGLKAELVLEAAAAR